MKYISYENQQITGILLTKDILPEYGYYFILANRDFFYKDRLETTLPIINQNKLKNIPFYYETIQEQKKFINFMQKISIKLQ